MSIDYIDTIWFGICDEFRVQVLEDVRNVGATMTLRGDVAHVIWFDTYFQINLSNLISDYNGYKFRYVD